MKKLLKISIFTLALFICQTLSSQTYVKMNALYAVVGVINPQLETVISNHSSLSLDLTFSPWRSWNGKHSQYGIFMGEYRYYFNMATNGLYLSANAAMMCFDINRPQFFKNGSFLSRQSEYGKGFSIAAGVGIGWEKHLSDRWIFDLSFAFDRVSSWYNRYDKSGEINMHPQGHEDYEKPDPFNGSLEDIPIKFAVSFGYKIIDPKNK